MLHFDTDLIEALGYLGLAAIIFAETGLLIGFFLPGDSLLFTAGFLASQGVFNIALLCLICFVAAVVGDATGYAFGNRIGRRLFTRPESRFFKPKHVQKAEEFFLKHGGKAIILARFLPVVRTFVPIIAGVGTMPYSRFALFNVTGGALWAIGLPVAGYFLGKSIPNVDRYLIPIVLLIIFLSIAPTAFHVWKENRHEIRAWLREERAKRRGKRVEAARPVPGPGQQPAGTDD
jgi:membrane-associated protein